MFCGSSTCFLLCSRLLQNKKLTLSCLSEVRSIAPMLTVYKSFSWSTISAYSKYWDVYGNNLRLFCTRTSAVFNRKINLGEILENYRLHSTTSGVMFYISYVSDRMRLCIQVYNCQHSTAAGYLAELCRPVSWSPWQSVIDTQPADRGQLVVPRVRPSTIRRTWVQSCRIVCLERSSWVLTISKLT